jgi:hypothetical protein
MGSFVLGAILPTEDSILRDLVLGKGDVLSVRQ